MSCNTLYNNNNNNNNNWRRRRVLWESWVADTLRLEDEFVRYCWNAEWSAVRTYTREHFDRIVAQKMFMENNSLHNAISFVYILHLCIMQNRYDHTHMHLFLTILYRKRTLGKVYLYNQNNGATWWKTKWKKNKKKFNIAKHISMVQYFL